MVAVEGGANRSAWHSPFPFSMFPPGAIDLFAKTPRVGLLTAERRDDQARVGLAPRPPVNSMLAMTRRSLDR